MKYRMSVKDFIEASRSGSIEMVDFYSSLSTEIEKLNKKYDFFQCISPLKKKPIKPKLFGLPISVKDNICVSGVQSSAGSKILDGYVPPFNATCVQHCIDNNAVVVGKTNQDEFGFGTFSTNSWYGIPKNPLDPNRSCGGSSGGAAGLTAALDYPHIALAESTGGSISCPAAFCSVVGLTPTYGLVSRYGLIDYANSLDKIGPMGRSVYDVALMLSMIAGHDTKDSTSLLQGKKDYTSFLHEGVRGMKIGVPKEYFENIEKSVEKKVWAAIKKLESAGAIIEKISLPTTRFSIASYYIIATAEASTNLAKYCGMRYGLHAELEGNFNEYFSKVRSAGFGEEAKRRIILGTFARMSGYRDAYYLKAMRVRTMIINDFKKAFSSVDVIAAPTMPILPPKFSDIKKLTPIENYQSDILTVPPNLAGIPMISLPTKQNEMIGLHLMADHLGEDKILKAAAEFEKIR
ncbi:MAG: Asp-tRNA(Asn)/Glu-tRNA(Gln) amidotransferase subunit GatA [Candidatus Aenigmarchaeota archaeon]|nr:Asp-tRNA(Asn)/Glu-tRNA(Gln) amidotransferase subunit GatA [Candidatus Aenigmarchaeota archaeon]